VANNTATQRQTQLKISMYIDYYRYNKRNFQIVYNVTEIWIISRQFSRIT